MGLNSYTEDDFSKASEYLRLALSLLSRHKIPPSPLNFRIGYDYVAGRDEELRIAFDEIIGNSDGLTDERLKELYRRYVVQDEKSLEMLRQDLRHVIISIRSELERSGGNLSSYAKTLDNFADLLDLPTPPETMTLEVRKVAENTRGMEHANSRLESNMMNIMAEIERMRRELDQVKEEVLTDALTGISNRKAFDSSLQHTIDDVLKKRTPFCILIADIDHFKQFNDNYGHLVGDKVLRFVASTLKRCLKGKDMAARYGGEEFTVILPETAISGAGVIAEQIRVAVSSGVLRDRTNDQDYGRITVSIGIAQYRHNELPHDLIQRADHALYLAKNRGRNRIEQAV